MHHVIEVLERGRLVTSGRGLGIVIDIRELHFANLGEVIETQFANSESFVAHPSYAFVKRCEITRIVNSQVRTPRVANE